MDEDFEIKQLRDVLRRFRDHVICNATQWRLGSMGSHHHPLWAEVNAAIENSPPQTEQQSESAS